MVSTGFLGMAAPDYRTTPDKHTSHWRIRQTCRKRFSSLKKRQLHENLINAGHLSNRDTCGSPCALALRIISRPVGSPILAASSRSNCADLWLVLCMRSVGRLHPSSTTAAPPPNLPHVVSIAASENAAEGSLAWVMDLPMTTNVAPAAMALRGDDVLF